MPPKDAKEVTHLTRDLRPQLREVLGTGRGVIKRRGSVQSTTKGTQYGARDALGIRAPVFVNGEFMGDRKTEVFRP